MDSSSCSSASVWCTCSTIPWLSWVASTHAVFLDVAFLVRKVQLHLNMDTFHVSCVWFFAFPLVYIRFTLRDTPLLCLMLHSLPRYSLRPYRLQLSPYQCPFHSNPSLIWFWQIITWTTAGVIEATHMFPKVNPARTKCVGLCTSVNNCSIKNVG